MTSCKPYLVRAMYEWIQDNNCTPYLVVNANAPNVQVPREHVKDGQIVLNISSQSTGSLQINDDELSFNARFGGQPRHLIVPIYAIVYIYAKETGEGMPFPPEDIEESDEVESSDVFNILSEAEEPEVSKSPLTAIENEEPPQAEQTNKAKSRSHLKVIK
nr:ClpXP protease specificity-enhancing factor [Algibacillus agarilyticus]